MYINPLLFGVLAAATFELVVIFGVAAWITVKGDKR